MGSYISKKLWKSDENINVPNKRETSLGCYGMRPRNVDFDSLSTLSASSFSCDNNGTGKQPAYFTKIKKPHEIAKRSGPEIVGRYAPVKDELEFDNLVNSSVCWSRSLLSRSADTARSASSACYEPTPLTEVLPQLYLGNEHDAEQAAKLIGLGISHVISIVGGGRYKDWYPNHMFIPLRDNGASDLLANLNNSYDFAMESQQPGNKLFVHCQLGQNRSASYVIGFLMKSKNLSLYDAYTLVKEKRDLIHPHKNYIEQLRRLDKELHTVYSTPNTFLDIALCSQKGIKIMHHNFSKVESENFKNSQKSSLKEDENDLSSVSSDHSQDRNCDMAPFSAFHLPDCDDSSNTSVVQLLTQSTKHSKSNKF